MPSRNQQNRSDRPLTLARSQAQRPRSEGPATIPRLRCFRPAQSSMGLTVLLSPDAELCGRTFSLHEQQLKVGRAPGPDGLQISDPLISRVHFVVERAADSAETFWLIDRKSLNGTRVHGLSVRRETLRPGDIVRVGETVLCFGPQPAPCSPGAAEGSHLLAGSSPALRAVVAELRKVAPTGVTVLIEGETGTGKELAAREVHDRSGRTGPFVGVNCTAIPDALLESELFGHCRGAFSGADHDRPGLIRAAAGGTLLLDEVGDLPLTAQAKLLRVLETREVRPVGATRAIEVDVRIVAATNQDLDEAVRVGRFRGDLLSRLAGWRVRMPPLRGRPEDLLPICRRVLDALSTQGRCWDLDADYFEALALYPWPYNVRELCTVLRRAEAELPEGGVLGVQHLPDALRALPPRAATAAPHDQRPPTPVPPPRAGEAPTARQLEALLSTHGGNISRVAQELGRDRGQVYRWLRRFSLDAEWFRPNDLLEPLE